MKQKHIVVMNGLWVGHHPTYVKTFVQILLGAGYRVSVFCPDPDEMSSWVSQNLSVESGHFKAYCFSDREPTLWKCLPNRLRYALWSLPRWFYASRALKKFLSAREKPDLVFFAWMDCYLHGYLPARIIDGLFPFKWSGLYFHPRYLRASKDEVASTRRRFFAPAENFIAQSKYAASIAVLDEGVVGALRSGLSGKPAVVFPDFSDEIAPVDRYHLAKEIKAKAQGRKIIGLLGALARRKGLLTLIRVVEQSAAGGWYFVFAGELLEDTFSKEELEEVKSFFNTQREDCSFHIHKIPDDAQFNALVNGCDVIFAMYEDFPHSSNLITKAALYGKSVLVSAGGYMEEVVGRYKLGEAVPAGDIQAALGALHRLTSGDLAHVNAAGMKEYAMRQSQENLRHALLDLVAASLVISPAKAVLQVNSVR